MKKILLVVFSLLLAVGVIAGCAAASRTESNDGAHTEMDYVQEAPAAEPAVDEAYGEEEYAKGEDSGGGVVSDDVTVVIPETNRKIIHKAYIATRTKDFDTDYQFILEQLETSGGYIQSSEVSGSKPENWQDEGRRANMVLRVPRTQYNTFLTKIEGIGETVTKQITGEDITGSYFDVESRIRVLNIRLERLESLLTESESLDHVLELEREIGDVLYELEKYEGQKREWDNLIDYTTVSIRLQEVHEVGELTAPKEDLGTRISNGFYSVLNALKDFFEGFLVVLIAALPVLIVLGVIAVIVVFSVRASRKRKAKKEVQKKQDNK